MKIVKAGKILTSEPLNAEIILNDNYRTGAEFQRRANETIRQSNETNRQLAEVARSIRKNYKKNSVANPSPTISTNGNIVTLIPSTNYTSMFPLAIDVLFGGVFVSETVTATIKVTHSDTTSIITTKTAISTGLISLSNTDLMSLIKDNAFITKIEVYSKSTIANSTAMVTFNHCGLYL